MVTEQNNGCGEHTKYFAFFLFGGIKYCFSDKGLGLLVAKVSDEHVLVSGEQIDSYTWILIEGDKIYEANQIDSDEDTMLIEKTFK